MVEVGHRYAFTNAPRSAFPAIHSWFAQQGIVVDWLEENPDVSDVEGEMRIAVIDVIEANHCPGACLFLFSLYRWMRNDCESQYGSEKGFLLSSSSSSSSSSSYGQLFFTTLYTGDFRYIPSLIDNTVLAKYANKHNQSIPANKSSPSIDHIYVDNTYCKGKYNFPSQEIVINTVISVLRQYFSIPLQSPPEEKNILVLFSSYTIGKEKVWLAVSKEFGLSVYVDE